MQKKYTFEQLRTMLKGLQWSDFHYNLKHDKHYYYDATHNVHFIAYLETGDSKRPSIRVKAQGQDVVFKFIDLKLYQDLGWHQTTIYTWRHCLNQLGPVVRSDE